MIKDLILQDLGIGVIPRYLAEEEITAGKLIQVLPKLSTLQVGVDCAIRRGKRRRACEDLFIEEIQNFPFKN